MMAIKATALQSGGNWRSCVNGGIETQLGDGCASRSGDSPFGNNYVLVRTEKTAGFHCRIKSLIVLVSIFV